MDVAYDRIQEETLSPDYNSSNNSVSGKDSEFDTNKFGTEIKEAYQVVSATPWASRLGGFLGQVRKQSENYYEGAKHELSAASVEASKSWTGLLARTRALSNSQSARISATSSENPTSVDTSTNEDANLINAVKDAETVLTRLRADAAARIKQIQLAEDAADEALERFGTNLASFLRDAVSVIPPIEEKSTSNEVLFESGASNGKRPVHATRLDAQLHAVHARPLNFIKEPDSSEFEMWKTSFDVENLTDTISMDLERYSELRRVMDSLVPEKVSYKDFWTRYYFFKRGLNMEAQKRQEILKDSQNPEEEVAWDDEEESDDVNILEKNPVQTHLAEDLGPVAETQIINDNAIRTTVRPQQYAPNSLLKPSEPRRSNEHSIADSDASYDMVSGAASQGGTPSEAKDATERIRTKTVGEQSDEEDWE